MGRVIHLSSVTWKRNHAEINTQRGARKVVASRSLVSVFIQNLPFPFRIESHYSPEHRTNNDAQFGQIEPPVKAGARRATDSSFARAVDFAATVWFGVQRCG
jgi:hypothetical protein